MYTDVNAFIFFWLAVFLFYVLMYDFVLACHSLQKISQRMKVCISGTKKDCDAMFARLYSQDTEENTIANETPWNQDLNNALTSIPEGKYFKHF